VIKLALVIGLILVAYSAFAFLADLLPIDLFSKPDDEGYYRIVASDSFSWVTYRLHALIVGLALIVFYALIKWTYS